MVVVVVLPVLCVSFVFHVGSRLLVRQPARGKHVSRQHFLGCPLGCRLLGCLAARRPSNEWDGAVTYCHRRLEGPSWRRQLRWNPTETALSPLSLRPLCFLREPRTNRGPVFVFRAYAAVTSRQGQKGLAVVCSNLPPKKQLGRV